MVTQLSVPDKCSTFPAIFPFQFKQFVAVYGVLFEMFHLPNPHSVLIRGCCGTSTLSSWLFRDSNSESRYVAVSLGSLGSNSSSPSLVNL